jgi:hypothetical protein
MGQKGTMGLKVRLLPAVIVIVGGGACAQLTGLPEYSGGGSPPDSESPVPVVRIEASADQASDRVGGEGPREHDVGAMQGSDSVLAEAEGADDASEGGDGPPIDTGEPSDTSLIPDGYACGPTTCGGCCATTGDCVGGQSVATCGVAGQKCQDCTSSGACSQGSCATRPPEAGPPPMCVLASCSPSHCAGYPIQGACCKLDQTCGCQWTIFAPCL